jgi:hypothetical protein
VDSVVDIQPFGLPLFPAKCRLFCDALPLTIDWRRVKDVWVRVSHLSMESLRQHACIPLAACGWDSRRRMMVNKDR